LNIEVVPDIMTIQYLFAIAGSKRHWGIPGCRARWLAWITTNQWSRSWKWKVTRHHGTSSLDQLRPVPDGVTVENLDLEEGKKS